MSRDPSAVNAARSRIERLLVAQRRAVAPGSRQRAALIVRLVETTGLSREGVEWALDHCLELRPSEPEIEALIAGVVPAPRAHVILPSNVFVAAHRALAVALAASPHVYVKPSRREPALVEALHAQAPDLFERVRELSVQPGDHVFAYGSDVTLDALRRGLPRNCLLHAHGSGFGVAVVELDADQQALAGAADAIARDTAGFDQRGCLSPRFVLALGAPAAAERFAERLASALAEHERQVPVGRLDPSELADSTWYRQCAACFGRVLPAGSGAVSVRDAAEPSLLTLDGAAALDVPPAGRHLEVLAVTELSAALRALQPWLTSVGAGSVTLQAELRQRLTRVRVGPLGSMQQPAFDGPVDRRSDARGERL